MFILLGHANVAKIIGSITDRHNGIEIYDGLLPNIFLELRHACLSSGEIACGHDHKLPIWSQFVTEHFAVGADLIDSGIGTGVGTENHSCVNRNSYTISHGESC